MPKFKPDINSQTTQNLIIAYYKALFSPFGNKYTLLYQCVRQFAQYFESKKEIEALEKIYNNCGGFALPVVETVVYRDINFAVLMKKTYNFQFRQSPVVLGDLIKALGDAKTQICDCFTRICKEHDIPQTFNLGLLDFDKQGAKDWFNKELG